MAIGKSRRDSLHGKGKQATQNRKQDQSRDSKRQLFLESLEDRRLLTVGPQLIGIQPNDGELLPFNAEDTYIRETAPRDLTFRFDENQVFNPNNLEGIQITRANLDGDFSAASVTSDFNTGGLVEVQFTAAKLGTEQNGIQLVFSKRDQGGAGAPEIGVVDNRVEISLNTNQGNESTVSDLLAALQQNSDAYALIHASVVSGEAGTDIATPSNSYSPLVTSGANDVVIQPGYVGVGDSPNEIIVRFSETLPDDLYQVDVFGEGNNALRNSLGMAVSDTTLDGIDNGSDVSTQFELDLGAQIISVVPQPIVRSSVDGSLSQHKDKILLYFNDDDLDQASAENTAFYQLIRTNDTTESLDDQLFNPVSAEYNAETDAVLLTFANDLDQLAGTGAFRLRVGTSEALPGTVNQIVGVDSPTNDFLTAQGLNAADLESGGVLISGSIKETENFPIDLPGDSTDPGHREINLDSQNHVMHDSADSNLNISTIKYCFQDDLGIVPGDTGGQPAYNNITEAQKQRTREILEQLSNRTGAQFIETENEGFIVATADLAVIGLQSGPGNVLGVNGPIFVNGELRSLVIMDDAEDWSDEFGGSWYQTSMHEIGHQLGLMHAYDLPAHTLLGQDAVWQSQYGPALLENDFPGDHDEVHLNHLHRPESRDIDLYEFTLSETGLFTAETIAERLRDFNDSNEVLNSALMLFRQKADGSHEVVAQNDDYFSDDSYLEVTLDPGTYFVGVSSTGNTAYNPTIPDSGFYGTSAGEYQLKMNFRPDVNVASGNVLVDADNPVDANRPEITPTAFDGDADGLPGGVFNFWFRAAAETDGTHTSGEARTVYVDKAAPDGGNGTLGAPFNNLREALNVSSTGVPLPTPNLESIQEGDILRIVSNAGSDGDIRTELDNLAYEIGFDDLGNALDDGAVLEIPKGVMVQIDAGAVMKMRRSWIGVGSTSPAEDRDRSGGAIQILGAPNFVDSLGNLVPETGPYSDATPLSDLAGDANESAVVHFTSYNDESIGLDTFSFATQAEAGDWGGILIHHGVDSADQTRFDYSKNGIFLNHINHADIRYGGGQVLVESVSQIIDPIEIVNSRPTISHNEISFSRDAAIAASPDSFKESNFHSPEYQEEFTTNPFTVDYKRIGPDIYGNRVHDNTTNGLAIRVGTLSGDSTQKLTVPGRLDDTDITHVLQENLVIESTPGGPFEETVSQSLQLVTLSPRSLGADGSLAAGTYTYKMVLVDKNGNESLATDASRSVTISGSENGVELNQLLTASGDFVARRLYRDDGAGAYQLIATINQTDTRFVDDGTTLNGDLDESATSKLRPRFDARLAIDPAVVLKLDGAHIHAEVGAQIIAEGRDGHEVVITSILDDRYGAGSTFDASNDGAPIPGGVNEPTPGSWGGIYAAAESTLSIDNAVISYGGGVTPVEGTFTAFNAIEVQQAKARIANSIFEFNAGGFGGQAPASRYGRGVNEESVIFARDAQPVIVGNTFRNNLDDDSTTRISVISINANSLNHELLFDYGRSTGEAGALGGYRDNHGPLVIGNRLSNNEINGMVIRGEVLTTQSIWDDTDITNVLFDTIVVPDFHTYGGLRLQSNPTQSLVVKLEGGNAGFDVTGRPLEIEDRIGGTIQIIGQPKSPVVITSLKDDSAGAGIQPNGDPMVDTNNDGEYNPADYVDQTTTRININYGPTMQNNLAAMQTVQRAADFWSTALADDVTVTIDAEFAALGGGVAGTMSPVMGNMLYDQLRDVMIADAQEHEIIVSQLPVYQGLTTDGADVPDMVSVTRANLKALGVTNLPVSNSLFGTGPIDGIMNIADTYDNAAADFLQIAIHEIGHALGFVSGVGNVDAGASVTNLTTMDMFRLAPGQGINNFTDAPRMLDPTKDHVFFDGGHFNPSRISTIAGLTRGDIPMSTGEAMGDGWQASHFKNRNLINGVYLGTMDPVANPAATENASENDKRVLDLIGWDVIYAGPAAPGDWNTVLIDQYAHDRNVSVVIENESRDVNAPGPNATALKAQFLGELAPNQKAGDDNRRLGFEVSGFLANPDDVDVFSFEAEAGTEVYIDIDKTTHALDAVLELLDSNDRVLVRSTNSLAESGEDAALAVDSSMQDKARVLHQADSPFAGKDYWAINPRDPGMRIQLPGPAGTRNTYHVRVRSNTPEGLIDTLPIGSEGLTSGAYQMQIRLEELDEVPGSMIQYASIGYATTGITVVGQPVHSFLSGETTETETTHLQNDSRATAQSIGNVLQSERGAISVAGYMHPNLTGNSTDWDEDYYRFEVAAQELRDSEITTWPVVIDLDWADGLGRPNLNLGIYDESGTLIYWSTDSNVADDRPRPNVDNQVEDLSRGSVGTGDPLIGPISLLPGVYYAVVSIEGHTPSFGSTTQLEPVNSLIRVAEDRIETTGTQTHLANSGDPFDGHWPGQQGGGDVVLRNPDGTVRNIRTFEEAQQPVLWNEQSVIPWTLSDVSLIVSTNDRMAMYDPFTGREKVFYGDDVHFGDDNRVGDIGRQFDGTVHAFSSAFLPLPGNGCAPRDDNNRYLELNTENGTATVVGATGIQTFEIDPANPDAYKRANNCDNADVGYGVDIEAMYYGTIGQPHSNDRSSDDNSDNPSERLLVVGNRNDQLIQQNGVDWKTNLVLELDPATGAVRHTGTKDPDLNPNEHEASLNAWAVGRILTGPELSTASFGNPFGAATTTNPVNFSTVWQITDGSLFEINDGFQTTTFEFDFGPEILQDLNAPTDAPPPDPSKVMKDGYFFVLDPDSNTVDDERVFQFDTGSVITFTENGDLFNDATVITINDGISGKSFEFEDTTAAAPDGLSDPTAQQVNFGSGTSAFGLAAELARVINANNDTVIVAEAVGNRVTLIDDNSIQISNSEDPVVGVRLEGGGGAAPILHIKDPSVLVDGNTFSVMETVSNTPIIFEFNDLAVGGGVTAGNIQVDFDVTDTRQQVAQAVAAAISGSTANTGLTAHVGNDRVTINGPMIDIGTLVAAPTAASLELPTTIAVEESFDRDEIGAEVQSTVSVFPGFDVGFYEDRINFLGAEIGDFSGVAPRWLDLATEGGISDPQHIRIGLLAHDQGSDYADPFDPNNPPGTLDGIASKIADAINANYNPDFPNPNPNQTVSATANGAEVSVTGGQINIPPGSPISADGAGPGGIIRGLTAIKDATGRTEQLFAVSDQGGLYEVTVDLRDNNRLNVETEFVVSSTADLNGINFTGLTVGPQNVEDGRYADLLFGIDVEGSVYAFDTSGKLQPVFVDGTSVLELFGSMMNPDVVQTLVPIVGDSSELIDDDTFSIHGEVFQLEKSGVDPENGNVWVDVSGFLGFPLDPVGIGGAIADAINNHPFPAGIDVGATVNFINGEVTIFGDGLGAGAVDASSTAGILHVLPDLVAVFPPVGLVFSNLDTNLFWNEHSADDASTQQNETFGYSTQVRAYCEADDSWDNVHTTTVVCPDPGGPLQLEVDKRQHDQGHGIPPSPDGTRVDYVSGHSSLHFGRGNVDGDPRSYDYIGGSYGSMVSNEFSLAGASPADKPTLYFNYFKDSDAASVSISDNGGDWVLVANLGNTGGVWDQQRVDLSSFAGAEHLRLKVDFTTGKRASGDELRAIEGQYIRDGETFDIDGQTFEFETGISFVLPSGGTMVENSTIELTDENDITTVFEFVLDIANLTIGDQPVLVAPSDSASEIATRFSNALQLAGYETHVNNERVNLPVNRLGTGPTLVVTDANTEPFLEGQLGLNVDPNGLPINLNAAPVFVHEGMDRIQVANELNIALETALYAPTIVTESGNEFSDGETFTLSDGVVDPATNLASRRVYEFDTGILIDMPVDGGASVADGETITFTNSANGNDLTFEFEDVDAADGVALGNIPINYQNSDLMISLAQKFVDAVDANGALLGLNAQVIDGNRVQIHSTLDTVTATSGTFGIDANSVPGVGLDIEIQASGADIADGETLTLTVPGAPTDTVTTFEFNLAGGVTGANVPVNITTLDTPADIATALGTAITAEGFAGVSITDHFVGLDNNAGVSGVTGVAGITIRNHETIRVIPGSMMTAAEVANVVTDAINLTTNQDIQAGMGDAQRMILLQHTSLLSSFIEFSEDTGQAVKLELETINDIVGNDHVKQHGDLLRIIGHAVLDAGPLGLFNNAADFGVAKLQDNDHEGLYLDDFVIGYAERGEMVTAFNGSDNYDGDPPRDPATGEFIYATEGAYQLEIRRGSEYVSLGDGGVPVWHQSFDTNDRHLSGFRIVAQDGADIADGDIFTLTDGMRAVNFEFSDEANNNGVTPGNFEILFNSEQLAWEVAISIRDQINRPEVRAVLDVTAALSDGTDGIRFPDDNDNDDRDDLRFDAAGATSTLSSNFVDLHGDAYILGDVSLRTFNPVFQPAAEPNDILAQAVDTGINGTQSNTFKATGSIGDNQDLNDTPGKDADLFRVQLNTGDTIDVQVTAATGSFLDPVVSFYDSAGNEIVGARVDTTTGGGVETTTFTAPTGGIFYIGISGFPESETKPLGVGVTLIDTNDGVDTPISAETGFYSIEISTGALSVDAGAEVFQFVEFADGTINTASTLRGDSNLPRQQGQILLHGNRIANSQTYGIHIEGGDRVALDGFAPHQGSVRQLDELNDEGLVPGVTVTNNLITYSGLGGIRFSGDTNGAGLPTAPVPFGRIINNTIVGIGGTIMTDLDGNDVGIQVDQNASPTLLNNIIANTAQGINVDPSSNTTVVGGTLYKGNLANTNYSGEDFAISLTDTDPLFVDPRLGVNNFYLEPGTQVNPNRAIDSSISSLGERFEFNLVKDPIGIAPSPIIAPIRDVTGQLRVDDPAVEPPNGLGTNVFIDRGALDRADFSGPTAALINPKDNDADGVDENSGHTVVNLSSNAVVSSFEIRLNDGLEPADPNEGVGVADNTVTTETVVLRRNGEILYDGIDYSFSYNETSDTIRLTPLSGIWTPDRIYTIELANTDHWKLVSEAGSNINDGDTFKIFDLEGNEADFEFERGYSLAVPQTLELQIPEEAGGLGGIVDGEVFSLRVGTNAPVVFEFDRDGDVTVGRTPILYTVNSTMDEIADAIVAAITNAGLGANSVNLGEGRIHVGSNVNHVLDTSLTSLTQTGLAGGIADGDYFTIDDGSKVITFEFENTEVGDGPLVADPLVGDVVIDFTTANTHIELAQIISDAINAEDLDLETATLSGGIIHVGGTMNHLLNAANSNLLQQGSPGVRPEFGLRIPTAAGQIAGLDDGQTFVVQYGAGAPVTFELNNLDVDPSVTLGNTRLDFNNSTTVNQLAQEIIVALKGSGLNLDPNLVTGTSIISFGARPQHTIDTSNTALIKVGDPSKPAAIPVNILPLDNFDGTQTAVQIIKAINSQDQLDGVIAQPQGADELRVTGALNVSTFSNAFLVDDWDVQTPRKIEEIEDLATNPLKANQLSGETMYTIQLGLVDYDMGDAPDGNGIAPQNAYPTISGHNPAIHMSGSTISLGERVDRDNDGQPIVSDDLDGEGYQIDTAAAAGITSDDLQTSTNLVVSNIDILSVTIDGAGFTDADLIEVGGITFEYDTSGVPPTNGNVVVDVLGSDTTADIATKTANAITAQGILGVTATVNGSDVIITSTEGTTVNADNAVGVDAADQRAHVADGETISITGGGNTYTVELDDDDSIVNGNIQVSFTATDDADTVAANITQALIDANIRLNLNPIARANGRVEITGDDADGVTGPNGAAIGFFNPYVFTELVVTASEDALLDAWIDYNRDGDWDDANEQIAASMQLTAGANELSVKAPLEPDSVPGQTYARFRISDVGGLRPTGLTTSGEIEDYQIEIVDGRPPEAIHDPSLPTAGYATTEDVALPVTAPGPSLLANDTDANDNDIRVDEFDGFSAMGAVVDVNTDWSNPTAPVATSGVFTYDPTTAVDIQALSVGEVVTDTFTYTLIEDTTTPNSFGFRSQTAATVSITLTGVNDAPVSQDLPVAAVEDGTAVTASFIASDVDNDDDLDSLTYSIVQNLASGEGTVANNGDGTFTFVPGSDFQELAQDQTIDVTFTYKATDQHGEDSNVSTVTITVTGVNDDPTAVADTLTVDQDVVTSQAAAGVLANDIELDTNDIKVVTKLNGTDLDGVTNSLTVTSTRGAEFTLHADGSFSYDPTTSAELMALDPGDNADDQFTYTMSDPHGQTSQTTITFTVNGVNDVPTAADDTYATGQNQVLDVDPAGVLGNDADADADDSITVTELNGSTTLTGSSSEGATVTIQADGSFSYDPTTSVTLAALLRGDTLDDTFTYTVEDSHGAISTATVTVVVTGENKAPVAVDDDFLGINGVDEDSTLVDAVGVLANDTDADDPASALFVSGINGTGQLTGQSTSGALITMNADGSFFYDPRNADTLQALADGVSAFDTFTYTVSDGQGGSSEGTVTIDVTGVNDAPVANPDSALGPRNQDLVIDVIKAADDTDPGHDYDVDGTIVIVAITEEPDASEGQVIVNNDNTVTFQPATDFSGTSTFKYQLTDDFGETSDQVTVTVEINDIPFAEDDSTDAYQDVFNTATVISVLDNDSDSDGTLDPSTVTIQTAPVNGNATVAADGSIIYQPHIVPDVYLGPDSLTYTVFDDDGAESNVATVTIDVILDPYPWHNRSNGMDVNNDGFISPLDALLIISELNQSGSYQLPVTGATPPPFYDVDADGYIAPSDAVQVINHLNDNANGEGEGEFVPSSGMDVAAVAEQAIQALAAPVNNGFKLVNQQTTGLSQVRSEVMEDLIADIVDEISEELAEENSLDDFFSQF